MAGMIRRPEPRVDTIGALKEKCQRNRLGNRHVAKHLRAGVNIPVPPSAIALAILDRLGLTQAQVARVTGIKLRSRRQIERDVEEMYA